MTDAEEDQQDILFCRFLSVPGQVLPRFAIRRSFQTRQTIRTPRPDFTKKSQKFRVEPQDRLLSSLWGFREASRSIDSFVHRARVSSTSCGSDERRAGLRETRPSAKILRTSAHLGLTVSNKSALIRLHPLLTCRDRLGVFLVESEYESFRDSFTQLMVCS